MRPVLPPAIRRLWRDRETLQLGRLPGRAVVLAGVDPGARELLTLLDGTRDEAQLVHEAQAAGCPPARTQTLLRLLTAHGLLADAAADRSAIRTLHRTERERLGADLASLAVVRGDDGLTAAARRRSAVVRVLGAGRVGAAVSALLATAGVGAVDVEDEGTARPQDAGVGALSLRDVGRSRAAAAREYVRAAAPSVDDRPQPPHLVVLAPPEGTDLDELRNRLDPRAAHLLAEVRDTVGVVGPLVLPGVSACLRCLDLTRTDLDPGWPAVAAQLCVPRRATAACDGVLAVAVAAVAAAQALALLDGHIRPAAVDGTLELTLPDWRWRRRTWVRHADCGCAEPISA